MAIENDVRYIDSAAALARLCRALRRTPWVALDTEFLRVRTYYPRLCLVQLASPDCVAVIDPLRLDELGPLFDLLYDKRVCKVVHAGRQDFEIFFQLRDRVPAPVFDTQVAAPLLGYGDQIGYAALVESLLGVRLTKAQTRTDWSRRPLSAAQMSYAADDVRYLAALYPRVRDALQQRGRRPWLDEEFAALADPACYRVVAATAWQRVKGVERLSGVPLSALQLLAAWRETRAQRADKPRGWILRDDLLLALADALPETPEALGSVPGIPPRVQARHAHDLCVLLRQARARTPDPLPRSTLGEPLSAHQKLLVDTLLAVIEHIAAREQLDPAVLASRRDLQRMVCGERELRPLRGWRRALLAAPLLAVLGDAAAAGH